MLVVGVTGVFGTGKTTVAGMLKKLGAIVIDADRIAHNVLKENKLVIKKIIRRFGRGILNEEGAIDRAKLGKIAFSGKKEMKFLCNIIHPEVKSKIAALLERLKKKEQGRNNNIVVLDAPLLIESGMHSAVDVVVVVTLDEQAILRRCKRNTFNLNDIKRRLTFQLPLESKEKFAGFIIDNSGTRSETRRQVQRLWDRLNRN